MSKVEIDRSRFLMIDRIVKTSDGYFIYIFGKNNMPEEMRERKNREYLCIRKIFKNSTKIKAVNYSTKENTFTINNTSTYSFEEYQKIFQKENNSLKEPSKKLGNEKDSDDDKFVTNLLVSLTGDNTFIGDDEGVAITERLLDNNSTNGFDIDIFDSQQRTVYEFLRRKNDYINNLTAHPMRYAWNPNNVDNRRKFISLSQFCNFYNFKLVFVSYSVNKKDSDIYKLIIPTDINPHKGFIKDTEYCLHKDDFLKFMKNDGDPLTYLNDHAYPYLTLNHQDFITSEYKQRLKSWAKNCLSSN